MLTRKYDENVLGTADYLAPEQADDSHTVDIRADIYSLGGTFYFLLTGKTPFGDGSVPQKLMWHRTRQPKAVSSFRADVPAEVQAIIDKMMSKEPEQRYQSAGEIAVALSPWTAEPIDPPSESEMPRLSPAVTGSGAFAGGMTPPSGPGSGSAKKIWQVTGGPPSPLPVPGSPSETVAASTTPSNHIVPAKMSAFSPPASTSASPSPRPQTRAAAAAPPARSIKPATTPAAVTNRNTEGSSPWTRMAPETPRPGAHGDTPTRGQSRPKADAKARAKKSAWKWAIALWALIGLLFLVALGGGVAYFGLVSRIIRFFSP
jgi:serine/threonine protein kinase